MVFFVGLLKFGVVAVAHLRGDFVFIDDFKVLLLKKSNFDCVRALRAPKPY